MNIFDTNQTEEEDALQSITNHGSSIHHAGFLSSDQFFGLSHDERLAVYQLSSNDSDQGLEANTVRDFGDVRDALGCDYVVDLIRGPENAVIAAGSHR